MNKDPDSKTKKKIALGKGLGALIPGIDSGIKEQEKNSDCDIDLIRPNQFQPRVHFSGTELEELALSIREKGILQPLLVRKNAAGFELIAGERRLRAAKMAGLKRVPVIIREVNDAEMLEMSIIENIQRENLNPIEEAEAYHRLMTEFKLTQDEASKRVGKSRPAVANLLRLRQLPNQIKESISEGSLSMGHARALLGAETAAQQNAAWRAIISKGLSVRETENLVKRLKFEKSESGKSKENTDGIYFSSLAEELSRNFGTKVEIIRHGKRGKIAIEFYSNDDLDNLIGRLKRAR
ncbi:MAG: ParB/RepB/Spo0J family partition protein [Desulfobacteraceae bacterium]|nr:MAG: ParB/RepB/Spo0J family partition protein [Desulfobacteraceae bacterium]